MITKTMTKPLAYLSMLVIFLSVTAAHANEHGRAIDIDNSVITEHETKILGKRVKYKATTGTQPVWNDKGDAVASLFYTYYQRTIQRWAWFSISMDARGVYGPSHPEYR